MFVDEDEDDIEWMSERDIAMYEMLRKTSAVAADNYKNKAWLRRLTEQATERNDD